MFAPRSHNENAIHAHQTAAAAKPLNQGLKGLAPKTPGNKLPKNDENAAIQPGKTGGGKGGKEGGGLKGEGWGFVTPAGTFFIPYTYLLDTGCWLRLMVDCDD